MCLGLSGHISTSSRCTPVTHGSAFQAPERMCSILSCKNQRKTITSYRCSEALWCLEGTTFSNQGQSQPRSADIPAHWINLRGHSDPYGGVPLLPFLLSKRGLTVSVPVLPISDAVHCNRSRSALHLFPHVFLLSHSGSADI